MNESVLHALLPGATVAEVPVKAVQELSQRVAALEQGAQNE